MSERDLVSTSAIAKMYAVTNKTAWSWTKRDGFPIPIETAARNSKWDRAEVGLWVEANCERSVTYGGWRIKADEKKVIYFFWAKDAGECFGCRSRIEIGQRCCRTVGGRNLHEECA